ncbi:hypothetical protein ACWDRB_47220 [Nonomuraea sp. NPDC003707]
MHTSRARYTVEIPLGPDPDIENTLADCWGDEFAPTIASVTWEWRPERGWQRWITVVGYRLLKKKGPNGRRLVGRRHAFHTETPTSPDYWRLPAKYQALADATSPTHFPLPA